MKYFPLSILLLCAFLLTHCASEAVPGGGPTDTIPPYIVFQNIENAATEIESDQTLIFTFSERLKTDQLEKNISLFPLRENFISIKYHNKSIEISPIDVWEENTIYTLIFEKGISDLRSNSLREPFQFTFTRGSYMPQTAIRGKILELEKDKSAKIFLSQKYQDPDSIILSPEYFTQNSPDGSFSFEYMPVDTFYIAAYIDEDKSNSYKKEFDLPCIPQQAYVLSDTLNTMFLLQAGLDNFLPGKLIKAESISPCETKLSFSKILSFPVSIDHFSVNATLADTLIYDEKNITLYHQDIINDSLSIHFKDLSDRLGNAVKDSSLKIAVKDWEDNLFHFENFKHHIRIYPDPGLKILSGEFHSGDTTNIELKKETSGFYRLPTVKNNKNGKLHLDFSHLDLQDSLQIDSLYTVELQLKTPDEYGYVIARLEHKPKNTLQFILKNAQNTYASTASDNLEIIFNSVLPGSYSLYYYHDRNNNRTRDYGQLKPFKSPEFLIFLEEQIDVKARWDTEIANPFKIDIDKK